METKFNFNSQVCTDKNQSERLLALGLKKETADCYYWQECDQYGDPNGKWHLEILNDDTRGHFEYLLNHFGICLHIEDALFIPAWSLHRLIEMMPGLIYPKEELPSFSGYAYLNLTPIVVWYNYIDYDAEDRTLISWRGNGIFSAVVDATEWLIKEGYFPKEYLV